MGDYGYNLALWLALTALVSVVAYFAGGMEPIGLVDVARCSGWAGLGVAMIQVF